MTQHRTTCLTIQPPPLSRTGLVGAVSCVWEALGRHGPSRAGTQPAQLALDMPAWRADAPGAAVSGHHQAATVVVCEDVMTALLAHQPQSLVAQGALELSQGHGVVSLLNVTKGCRTDRAGCATLRWGHGNAGPPVRGLRSKGARG